MKKKTHKLPTPEEDEKSIFIEDEQELTDEQLAWSEFEYEQRLMDLENNFPNPYK